MKNVKFNKDRPVYRLVLNTNKNKVIYKDGRIIKVKAD